MIDSVRHLPYETGLEQLKLWSLKDRRIRADLNEVFKIVHVSIETFFEYSSSDWVGYPSRAVRFSAVRFHALRFSASVSAQFVSAQCDSAQAHEAGVQLPEQYTLRSALALRIMYTYVH